MSTFGKNLEILLKRQNLSVRKFASEIGANNKTVSSWIGSGGSFPSDPIILKKIAERFDVSIHELIYGEPDPKSIMADLLQKTEVHTGLYEISIKKVNVK